MAMTIIVIENKKDWRPYYPSENVVLVDDFIKNMSDKKDSKTRVINLCRNYKYLSVGYYCSLLAEARDKRVIPTVQTINDLNKKRLYSLNFEDLEPTLKKLQKKSVDHIVINIFFGFTNDPHFEALAHDVFDIIPCPLIELTINFENGTWKIETISSLFINDLNSEQEDFFASSLENYTKKIWTSKRKKKYRYDLAILQNPLEKYPPSNPKALKNFIKVGKKLGIYVDLIEKKDFQQLLEYDALFIRETTSADNHTYHFAKKAEKEDMIVIDDTVSILRCTNKIYLANLLAKNKIQTPKFLIIHKKDLANVDAILKTISFPMVVKIPDGSFSRGISKVKNEQELRSVAKELFKQSDLILIQEYLFTEYDWRIGVLNKQPIFACQYFMSKGHWQIYNHKGKGKADSGGFKTLPIFEAPESVVSLASKAAGLIGDSLYGVDIKMTKDGPVIIEVNDNPNIDAGVEDVYLKDKLYTLILEDFIRRLENKHKA